MFYDNTDSSCLNNSLCWYHDTKTNRRIRLSIAVFNSEWSRCSRCGMNTPQRSTGRRLRVGSVSYRGDGLCTDGREVDRLINCTIYFSDEGAAGGGQSEDPDRCRMTGLDVHHVALDKVQPEWDFLHTFVNAIHALFGLGENDVRLLVKACQYTHDCPPILKHEKHRTCATGGGA